MIALYVTILNKGTVLGTDSGVDWGFQFCTRLEYICLEQVGVLETPLGQTLVPDILGSWSELRKKPHMSHIRCPGLILYSYVSK